MMTRSNANLAVPLLALALAVSFAWSDPAQARKKTDPAQQQALETLERASRSGDIRTRAIAVKALAYGPKKRVIKILKEAVTDPQWMVRRAALDALATVKDKSWKRHVITAMGDLKVDVEREIMPLIESLGPKKGTALIAEAVRQKGFPQPERYAEALKKRGGTWMVTGYRLVLKRKKDPAAGVFAEALPDLPLPDAVPLYKERLTKLDPAVQKKILEHARQAPADADISFVRPLLKSQDAGLAFETARILAHRKDASGKAILMAAAEPEDSPNRLAALDALGHIATKDMFALVRPIVKDRTASYDLLVAAYRIFLNGKNPKLAKHFEGKLAGTEANHRAAAVHFLADVKGRAALADLYPLLVNAPTELRMTAAKAIGRLGLRESIPKLAAALRNSREKELTMALLESLQLIRDADVIPVVRFHVTDRDTDVRRLAVKILADLRHEDAIADLEVVMSDRQKDIREMALAALVDVDPAKHILQYKRALGWLPVSFLETLVERHRDKVIPHLKMALSASREELRQGAFDATASLRKPEQVTLMTEVAETSNYLPLRLQAIDRLVALQKAAAGPLLEKLAKDKDEQIKVAAIGALGDLGLKDSKALLLATTADPAERIRVAAAAALIRL